MNPAENTLPVFMLFCIGIATVTVLTCRLLWFLLKLGSRKLGEEFQRGKDEQIKRKAESATDLEVYFAKRAKERARENHEDPGA